MSTTKRWAVIRKFMPGEHGDGLARDEVISTELREEKEGPPEMRGLRSSPYRDRYVAEIVGDHVRIGMVRTADGFRWPANVEVREPRSQRHVVGTKPRRVGPGPKQAAVRYGE